MFLKIQGEDIERLQAGIMAMKQAVLLKRIARGGGPISPPWYLMQLADLLSDSIKEEIRGGGADARGFYWHGKLYDSTAKKKISDTEVDIVQSSEGNFVMYGTKPHPDADYAPRGLVEWAMDKYQLSLSGAYPRAVGVFRKGTLSRSRMTYPSGARGFNYAEWVVMAKEKGLITDYAGIIAGVVVKYLQI